LHWHRCRLPRRRGLLHSCRYGPQSTLQAGNWQFVPVSDKLSDIGASLCVFLANVLPFLALASIILRKFKKAATWRALIQKTESSFYYLVPFGRTVCHVSLDASFAIGIDQHRNVAGILYVERSVRQSREFGRQLLKAGCPGRTNFGVALRLIIKDVFPAVRQRTEQRGYGADNECG
jgi:hypothetical protein